MRHKQTKISIIALLFLLFMFISLNGCILKLESSPEKTINPEKCPDGVWDEAEQKDPDLCPEDKPNGTPQPNMSDSPEPEGIVLNIPHSIVSIPLSIENSIENSCIGFKIAYSPDKMATINMIGAGWTTLMWPHFTWGRIEKKPGLYDFSEMDKTVKAAQENNIATLAELQPFADWDQDWDPDCRAKKEEYLCKPKDMQAYKRFVAKTVERYDGDGENDMPGLKIPIRYWEIINEPDIKEDPKVIFFVGDEEDYFEVLKESYQTIKQVCPDCKVLQGAAAAVESTFLSFWDNIFELGGADYFDIANVHYVGRGDLSTLNVRPFKELLDKHSIKKPIWVTEAVLQSSSARSSLQGALSAGASKVFFVGFGVGESAPAGEYSADFMGITESCPQTT